jgi:hypothetical protein
MDLNIHNVVKIEVKPRTDLSGFSTRNLVIHSKEYNWELQDYITNKFTITTFFDDKDIAKLSYSKE